MKKNKGWISIGLSMLALGILLGGCDLFASVGLGNSSYDNNINRLKALGVQTEVGKLKDPEMKEVRDDYNPMTTKRKAIFKYNELYLIGASMNCSNLQELINDEAQNYALMFTKTGDISYTRLTIKGVGAGDIDGDGLDEVIAVTFATNTKKLNMRIIDQSGTNYSESSDILIATISDFSTKNFTLKTEIDVEAGDIDGDGNDEVIIGFDNYLFVRDDSTTSFKQLGGLVAYDNTYSNDLIYNVRVDTGDLDCDGRAEIVAVDSVVDTSFKGNATYHIYKWDGTALNTLGSALVQNVFKTTTIKMSYSDVAIGDIDGDSLLEIVFGGVNDIAVDYELFLMDDFKQSYAFSSAYTNYSRSGGALPAVAVLDFDGDNMKEFVFHNKVMENLSDAGNVVKPLYTYTAIRPIASYQAYDQLSVGDMNRDLKEDIVYAETTRIAIVGMNSVGVAGVIKNINYMVKSVNQMLTTANVDIDSPVIEFVSKELVFTSPIVIAVLACPPVFNSLGQNTGNSGTSFGKSSASGVEKSRSLGFSVGVSIGFETEDRLFSQSKFAMKASIEQSFDWISSSSREIETYVSYNTGELEDGVVFTAVPVDVYYYKILSSPDSTEIGKIVSINVPRKNITTMVEKDFYNLHNGDADDIGSDILGHTLGNPWTYPSKSAKDTLIAGGKGIATPVATVGQGNGTTTVGINVTDGSSDGFEYSLEAKVEVEGGVGGVVAGVSAGFNFGMSYTVSSSKTTTFEGTVGHIPSASYSANMYNFGLFYYKHPKNFFVIDYWVEK